MPSLTRRILYMLIALVSIASMIVIIVLETRR